MNILAIHDGHNATACHLMNGKVVSLVSEERFTNKKNQFGFPERSVRWILEKSGLTFSGFDFIAFPHLVSPSDFSNLGSSGRYKLFMFLNYALPPAIIGSEKLIAPYVKIAGISRLKKIRMYQEKYGLRPEKCLQVEHHLAHGYAALHGSGFTSTEEKILIFTCDNSGDGISASVCIWDPNEGYRRIQETQSFHSLGDLFARVTIHLGMKPGEDEYKLMGMAPYVQEKYFDHILRALRETISLEPDGRIRNKKYFGENLQKYLDRLLTHERFDNVAAAVQKHFEEVILGWVNYWVERTGVGAAVFGGGCFMNVKANSAVTKIKGLKRFFFCPSSGDESTALGAAFWAAAQSDIKATFQPLGSLSLGPEFDDASIERELKLNGGKLHWRLSKDVERETARLISDGNIVARFGGPAEWGARALGGRSILCRADDLRIVHKLNKSIKMRDFWMPFAASLLEEDADRYLYNPKDIYSPYMMLSFDTKEPAMEHLAAAIHPFDHTCRAQVVGEKLYPSYFRILKYFKEITGIGGILNSSFNLHGYPIVGDPGAAIHTLLNSRIDILSIGNFIVERNGQE